MTPGRLIAVVGPSGVGKDSVMAGLLARRSGLLVARRAITRPADPESEDFEPLDAKAFAARRDAGDFCLHWQAHGLSYGIPANVVSEVMAGRDVLVNLSRTVLASAAGLVPRFVVLNITARPETLARRLADRGREGEAGVARRLARRAALPAGLEIVEIPNDGALVSAIDRAEAALFPEDGSR